MTDLLGARLVERGWQKRGKNGKPALPPHDDLTQRDFTAEAANQPTPMASD
jgi:hypothetical protein